MPMIGEVVIAMLATQKLGSIFIPIFSGYAPKAVRERLEEAGVKLVFTADVALRRGKAFALKNELDGAIDGGRQGRAQARHLRLVQDRAAGVRRPSDRRGAAAGECWPRLVGPRPAAVYVAATAALRNVRLPPSASITMVSPSPNSPSRTRRAS